MKRTLVLVLALLLLVTALPAMGESELNYDAPIVMWLPGNGGVSGLEEGATENDNQFINAIREATGYANLTVEVMPATDAENAMNLRLAAGDYPDVIYVNGARNFYLRYQTEGLWAPVDEAVEKYGPAIQELVTEEAWATVQGDDGQHYGIPNPLHTSYNGHLLGNGILYRKDWLDDLGLEAPTNAEEFRAVLEAIKEADPAGDGNTIPYSFAGIDINGPEILMAAFGMWRPYAEMEDGTLANTRRLYAKDFAEYMHGLYADGLLDQEVLYQEPTNVTEKFLAGTVFAINEGVWCKTIRQSWDEMGYDYELAFMPIFTNNDGTQGPAQPFPVANCYLFPSTTQYMNEVVDLVNTFLTDKDLENFINFGIEGVHYTIDEDGVYHTIEGEAYDSIIYKIYYRLWFKPDVWWHNAVLGDFVPEIQLYDEAFPNGPVNVNIFSYMPTTEAKLEYESGCNDIYEEYMSKIITGELPLEAIDEMFAMMDDAGYTEIEAADQEWYETTGRSLMETLQAEE